MLIKRKITREPFTSEAVCIDMPSKHDRRRPEIAYHPLNSLTRSRNVENMKNSKNQDRTSNCKSLFHLEDGVVILGVPKKVVFFHC